MSTIEHFEDCSVGRHGFAIGYSFIASIFTITIIYLTLKLIHEYRRNDKLNRPPKWLFYSGLLFVLLGVVNLAKCIIYGLTYCNYITINQMYSDLIFEQIFGDLYVIQLYFLWIVLFIRLYYIFYGTQYTLSKLTIRIYCIIFIFSPLLTVLISVKELYTIFIVLGLSGGIFITLSMIILYIFKLIQVYTRYSDYQEHTMLNDIENKPNHRDVGLLTKITKNTILIVVATLFSLLILFILIMNFIFKVYNIRYGYQRQFLDICLLLDVYITTICIIFQFNFLHSSYEYFCGCIDIVCRYYCNQFVNPSMPNNMYPLQPIKDYHQAAKPRVSVELRPPNNHGLNGGIIGARKEAILSDSERSPSSQLQQPQQQQHNGHNGHNGHNAINLHTPTIENEDDRHESASYDVGKKADFEDLPSLPMAESKDKSTNDIKKMLKDGVGGLYVANDKKLKASQQQQQQQQQQQSVSGRSPHHLKVPSYSSKNNNNHQQNYGNNENYRRDQIFNNYQGIALHDVDQKMPELEMNRDSIRIKQVLTKNGFNQKYTKRALAVYEKHYGTNYDIKIIREIIYRLTVKDKLKELKRVQNLYQSRDAVEEILLSLNFSHKYVNTALTMYEVMAEMFEINKHHENIYDLELVTEMIMRLRAKDRERGELIEDGDNMIMHNQDPSKANSNQSPPESPDSPQQRPRKMTADGVTKEQDTHLSITPDDNDQDLSNAHELYNNHNRINPPKQDKRKRNKAPAHAIVTNGGLPFNKESAFSVDASVPSSAGSNSEDEENDRMHVNAYNGVLHEDQETNDRPDSNLNSNTNVDSNQYLESPHDASLEITMNTNDMEADGEQTHSEKDNDDDDDDDTQQHENTNMMNTTNRNINRHHHEQSLQEAISPKKAKKIISKSATQKQAEKYRSKSHKRRRSKSKSKSKSKSQSRAKHHRRNKSKSKSQSVSQSTSAFKTHHTEKSGYQDTGQYVNNLITHNNVQLKQQFHINSKGDYSASSKSIKSPKSMQKKQSLKSPQTSQNAKPYKKDINRELLEAYIAEYGVPEKEKHLISFAKQKGVNMTPSQATIVMAKHRELLQISSATPSYTPQPADHPPPVHNNYRNHSHSKSTHTSSDDDDSDDDDDDEDDDDSSEHSSEDNAPTATNPEDHLKEIQELQGLIHRDMHHSMDEYGNMGDDMDDMEESSDDDDEEIIAMDESSSDDDSDDDDDLEDIEDVDADALYDSSRTRDDDDDGLPGIPKIRPNDHRQNIMPIVPDNMPQNYDYTTSHRQQFSGSSEIEYEEEYYEEEDDEYDENGQYFARNDDEKQSVELTTDDGNSSESTLATQSTSHKKNRKRKAKNVKYANHQQMGSNGTNITASTEPYADPLDEFRINTNIANARNHNGNIGLHVGSPLTPTSVDTAATSVVDDDYMNRKPSNPLVAGNHAKYYMPKSKIRHKVDTSKSRELHSTNASILNNAKIDPLELDNMMSDD